jgi:phosphate-selective porin OprO/OprP
MSAREYSPVYRPLTAALLLAFAAPALADESTERIKQLEAMMQQMQQQRAEQDKQMQVMAEELKAMQQQMAQGKEANLKERGKSTGTPVLAAFKDGITFEDGSGNWQLAINGRVQADYRHFNPEEAGSDSFSLRRARLGGTLTFYKDYVVRVEGEYSGSSTTLTYGYFDINKWKAAKIRMGQFKPLYGLERAMSTNFIDFQERSMADALLGGTFDRGVMVHGSPLVGTYYSVAYVNGNNSGTSVSDETDVRYDNKDLMVRLTGNLAEMAGWKGSVVHLGGFYSEGEQEPGSAVPQLRTEGRGTTFFTTTNSNAFADKVDRKRGGAELALAHGPVKFQSEYIRVNFDGEDFERDMSAWYATASWMLTGEHFADSYKDGAFGRIRPKQNFQSNGTGWGALQLALRYSSFDGDEFDVGNAAGTGRLAAGRSNKADAWTLGMNWILNPNVRLVTNFVHTNFDSDVTAAGAIFDDEDALTMRAQFDF